MLNQCLESLVQKIQSGVVINFEKTGPDPPPIEGESTPRREQLVHAAGAEAARIRPTAIHPVHLRTQRPLSPLGPKQQVTIQKRYSIRIPVLIREDAPTHRCKSLGQYLPLHASAISSDGWRKCVFSKVYGNSGYCRIL